MKDYRFPCRMHGNRVSARNSGLRNIDYIERLRNDIEMEKAKLSRLLPNVYSYDLHCSILQKNNEKMKEIVEALENEKARKEAEFQALKEELQKLSEAFKQLKEEN